MAQRAGKARALGMVAVVVLVGLTACGDDNKDSGTAAGGQAATTVASTPATTVAVATTQAAALLKTASKDPFGTIVVDAAGKALYTFDRDTTTTSSCTGGCATTWPPLLLPAGGSTPIPATGVTGTLAVSARPEGGSQITLNNKPLYRYSGDANPGDVNGDGIGGTWHVAKI